MADDPSNVPAGAVPPKKETGKVQPKKETVRISLPPKPTSAPTIKLPTLPAGGGAPPAAARPAAPARPAAAVARPGAPKVAAPAAPAAPTVPGRPVAAPGAPGRSAAAAPAARGPRPRTAPAGQALSKLDMGLAVAAAVLALAAIGSVLFLLPIQ